jgi:hypothetical protein
MVTVVADALVRARPIWLRWARESAGARDRRQLDAIGRAILEFWNAYAEQNEPDYPQLV